MMTRTVFILLISSLLYAKLLYAEDRACSNRGLNSCGFYIEGFRCDHGDFASHIEIEKELLYDKHTLEDTYPLKIRHGVPVGENERKIILIGVDPKGAVSMGDLAEL